MKVMAGKEWIVIRNMTVLEYWVSWHSVTGRARKGDSNVVHASKSE